MAMAAVSQLLLNTFFVTLFLFPLSLHSAPEASLITGLPGFSGTFPSKHYSGYVRVGRKSAGVKNLFYYFVVSERNPSKDPVVLWLNGGPGCSSFDGYVYENGPFNFEKAKNKSDLPTLHLNRYSWSKVSNIIYLDSPAGVGFSYPTGPTGDFQTANDTRDFLLKWFELYPEFQANPFYISGESYAGIYIPTLVDALDKAKSLGAKPNINIKGYLIGNGVCDNHFDGDNALVRFAHGMGLASDALYKEADQACHGDFDDESEKCASLVSSINRLTLGLNIYDILEPCYHKNITFSDSTKLPASFRELGKTDKPLPVRNRIFGRAWPYRAPVRDGIVPTWSQLTDSLASAGSTSVPCIDDEVATEYLNDKAVRKALHVNPKFGSWNLCNDLTYNHDAGSMIPYHKNLTNKGYRALIYSGDHDMCVPYTGTETWTASLGLPIVDQWRPWSSNHQVAGYLQGYAKNLTFLTIKGAGHTVPEYKPRESLHFYDRWLRGLAI